jgi:hypothetical protein
LDGYCVGGQKVKLVDKMLIAEDGYDLKFKNDIGYVDGEYFIQPRFFHSCYPDQRMNTIKKAKEIFEEILLTEEIGFIQQCKMQLQPENIEEEE